MKITQISCFAIIIFSTLSVYSSFSLSDRVIPNENEFVECLLTRFQLNSSLPSEQDIIYTPDNPSYSYILNSKPRNSRVSSLYISNKLVRPPILIVTPRKESHIQATIYCARRNGVQIRVRSGGHDYEGLSYVSRNDDDQNVVPFGIVDMRNLASVYFTDPEVKTVWVEAGATLGELYYAVAQKSRTRTVVGGLCPTVGVGGYFSGGGYSMLSRKHGMASDNIVDARLIDADGRILDRKSMGEDLWWAIRGGGGTSFGIVVAFELKLAVIPETITVFNVSRTLEHNTTELIYRWQYIADKIDNNLSFKLFIGSVPSMSPNGKRSRTIVASFTSLFLGSVEDLLPLMQEKFLELGLVEEDCIEMSWIESVLFFAGINRDQYSPDVLLTLGEHHTPSYFKSKSDYVQEPIPERGLRRIWRFLHEEDAHPLAELQFTPLGGIISALSESETPFPHRAGNMFMIHYVVFGNATLGNITATDSQRHLNWMNKLYEYMAPYVSKCPRAAYFNYRDLDLGMNIREVPGDVPNTSYEQARTWGFKYFKGNFDRLVRVKTKVDPSNFFRNEQSIPPLSSSSM